MSKNNFIGNFKQTIFDVCYECSLLPIQIDPFNGESWSDIVCQDWLYVLSCPTKT